MNKNHYAVIMAGGVGSRFWPLSRQKKPKQFIDLFGNNQTLFQLTFERFRKFIPAENIYIVANEMYREFIIDQVPDIDPSRILLEPHPRNTAPCIAYATFRIHKENPDAVIIAAPSDHLIKDTKEFSATLTNTLEFAASNNHIITLGIKPSSPETGYGYIQFIDDQKSGDFYKVKTFTEKPNKELAKHFISTGEFLWNAGIFVSKTETLKKAYADHLPEIFEIFEKRIKFINTKSEPEAISKAYELCTNTSIDYGIMEKANNVYVTPADFSWSDLGTWKSLFELLKKDNNNNLIQCPKHLTRNTSNCLVHVKGKKLVALNNVKNLIVVESDGILLIADLDKEQEIRQVVNESKINWGDKFS